MTPQVITCVQTRCINRRLNTPATMLLSLYDGPGKPACESCARWCFDQDITGNLSILPLSQYVDFFAEAKQAAFATPGQVERAEPAGGPSRRTWDTGEAVITSAPARPVAQPGNGFTAEERARRSGGRVRAATPSRKAAWWTAGISSLTSIALGIVLCSESVHMQQSFMTIWGVFFIALPFLIGAAAAVISIIKLAAAEGRHYKAWKATLSPADRLALDVAETAALYAGWAGAHHVVKERKQRSAAAFQARSAASAASSERHRQAMSQPVQAGMPPAGGPGPTRRSDIFGNFA